MKEKWTTPELKEFDVKGTAYDPNGGKVQDGTYVSVDGKYNIPTFGTSLGNNGVPDITIKPEQ